MSQLLRQWILRVLRRILLPNLSQQNQKTILLKRPTVPSEQPPQAAVAVRNPALNYGPFDADGIPLRDFGGNLGIVWHPLVVTEVGHHYWALYIETKEGQYRQGACNLLRWVLENQSKDGCWRYSWSYEYEGASKINPPWTSAVMQGCGAQFLLDMRGIDDEIDAEFLVERARLALLACGKPIEEDGLKVSLEKGCFFEEFPGEPPTHILNGHLRVLMACYLYLEVREDRQIRELLEEGMEGLHAVLPLYQREGGSRYDLRTPTQWGQQFILLEVASSSLRLMFDCSTQGKDQILDFRGIRIPRLLAKKIAKSANLSPKTTSPCRT